MSECHLAKCEKEGDSFLNQMMVTNGKCTHHSILESEQASNEWRKKGEPEPLNAKSQISPGKVMAAILFDRRGLYEQCSFSRTADNKHRIPTTESFLAREG